MSALVLGHGPSIVYLRKDHLDDKDLIVTCHDDCGILDCDPDRRDFTIVSCDAHDIEIEELMRWQRKGFKVVHLYACEKDKIAYRYKSHTRLVRFFNITTMKWEEVNDTYEIPISNSIYREDWKKIEESRIDQFSRALSGMGAINYCLSLGYNEIYSLGLDFTYASQSFLSERVPHYFQQLKFLFPNFVYHPLG